MRSRRALTALVATALVLVLAACTGLPTSGPVNVGREPTDAAEAPDFSFVPDRPQPGATAEQIVDGFVRAGSGPAGDWSRARLFLTDSFRNQWDPTASVTIDVQGDRRATENADDAVSLTLTSVANVDERGAYTLADSETTVLQFALVQEDGEWRISAAPDGVVLDQDFFTRVYRPYSLMFFDPTWQYLVPDVRWFPPTNTLATVLTAELLNGPSPWLSGAVASAFPDSVSLEPRSVPVISNVADVSFNTAALDLDASTLSRMQTQLDATLATATITAVEMTVGSTALPAEPQAVRSTSVSASPLVLTGDDFGFLTGAELDPISGLSDAMMQVVPAPVAAQVSPNRDFAAVRLAGEGVFRVDADGAVTALDTRPDLIDPTVDPFGYTWSVPRDAASTTVVFDEAGQPIPFPATWSGASQISAMSLSHDGARLAVVITTGGRSATWVAGVVRDAKGVPLGLSAETLLLGPAVGRGVALTWLDNTTVGILSSDGDRSVVSTQRVGGPVTSTDAPVSAVSIAGANQSTTVRLRGSDGALYIRRGSNWQQTASGIDVLATQQGQPQ
ncbi:LpqB family beta-propeller domain-containing protein [Microbacterium sp. P03]|uniref:LpqB family beta-propeller domain-containing protein n=1 Tax=Microbacterium sp. P03 TaxID=3366946 RepID=UPI003745F2DE